MPAFSAATSPRASATFRDDPNNAANVCVEPGELQIGTWRSHDPQSTGITTIVVDRRPLDDSHFFWKQESPKVECDGPLYQAKARKTARRFRSKDWAMADSNHQP
jgi:hypothetical protein